MPSKEEKAQGQAPKQSTDDTTAAEAYAAADTHSSDAADYELREVKDSPIPGHVEQVRKGS